MSPTLSNCVRRFAQTHADANRSSLVGLQVGGQRDGAVVLEAAAEGISGASAETCGVTHCDGVVAGGAVSYGGAEECKSRSAHVRREVGRSRFIAGVAVVSLQARAAELRWSKSSVAAIG